MQQRVVTGGFIFKNGKFLIVKRAENDTFYPNYWEIPGGKVEYGEEPDNGALRELEEEVGLKVKLISPISVINYGDLVKDIQYIQINYLCKIEGEQEVKLSEEHSGYKWVTFSELENYNMHPDMKKAILNIESHLLLKR